MGREIAIRESLPPAPSPREPRPRVTPSESGWAGAVLQRRLGGRGADALLARLPSSAPEPPQADAETEAEADRMAERARDVEMPGGLAAPPGERVEQHQIDGLAAAAAAMPAPPDLAAAVAEPGRPLDPELRRGMEEQLDAPLGAVRVHTGTLAEGTATARGAEAFAFGVDIMFGAGAYVPHTEEGRLLLAHELAHVLQQASRGQPFVGRRGKKDKPPAERPIDAVALTEWRRNPPLAKMTASLSGLTFTPANGTLFVLPDPTESPTAVVLKRLAGPDYTEDLLKAFLTSVNPKWTGNSPDRSYPSLTVLGDKAPEFLAFLDDRKIKVEITAEQRALVASGAAFSPVPKEIWASMPLMVDTGPGPADRSYLVHRPAVLRQLAAIWWTQAQTYVAAYSTWRGSKTAENADAAGAALSTLIEAINPFERALWRLHEDTALVALPEYRLLWPPRDGKPGKLEDITDELAVQFVTYAASQPADFMRSLRTDPAARLSLLRGFVHSRGDLPRETGDQTLLGAPSTFNAPALPVRMSSTPSIGPPLFGTPAGASAHFLTSVEFSNMFEAFSNAMGGWRYEWDAVHVPGDELKRLGEVADTPMQDESFGLDSFKQDVGRDWRNAGADLKELGGISGLISVAGPPGANPISLVGVNLVVDVVGTVVKSIIRELTQPQSEMDIPFAKPGLYLVRCKVGPRLSDTSTFAQMRREPAVAWMIARAYDPKDLARQSAESQIDLLAAQEAELARLRRLLAGQEPDANPLTAQDKSDIGVRIEELDLALHGSELKRQAKQRATLDAHNKRLKSGKATDEDKLVTSSALESQIEEIDLLAGHRRDRAGKLGAAPHQLTAVFVKDYPPSTMALAIEAAQLAPAAPGKWPSWFVSDLTSSKSGMAEARGNGTLVPDNPAEDSIMAALKDLLRGESGYGRGNLSVGFPAALKRPGETVRTRSLRIEADKVGIALHAIESIGTLLSIAAVVAAPFTAGGSLVLLMPAGLIGAIPSGYRLAHRAEMGTLHFNLETAMQVLDVATAVLQVGELGAGARAVARAGTTKGLSWAIARDAFWISGIGANGLGMVMMGKSLVDQLSSLQGLPPGLRAARAAEIIGNAMLQAGIQIGAHLASSKYLHKVEASVRGVAGGESPSTFRAPPHAPELPHGRPPGRSELPVGLTRELPPDLRASTPIDIDPNLKGATVHVDYAIDPKTGRVDPASVRIVAGHGAGAADIALHGEAARALRAYGGLLGAVHEKLQTLRGIVEKQRSDPQQGSAAWEAQLELAKLKGIVAERMRPLKNKVLDEMQAADIVADIVNLKAQLADAERILAGLDPADPKGFIAADSREQRGVRIGKENRTTMAARDIAQVTLGPDGATVRTAAKFGANENPAPGYSFRETPDGIVMTRLPSTAKSDGFLVLIGHGGKLYVAPAVRGGSATATHANNVRAQLDGYPPPKPGHYWTPDPPSGWQLRREANHGGPAKRLVKEAGQPKRGPKGEFLFDEIPRRIDFDGRLTSAATTQSDPATRNTALETVLDSLKVSAADRDRGILRKWSPALDAIGKIAGESLGRNLPMDVEIATRAVGTLAERLGSDGSFSEGAYDRFRYAIRDSAIGAIFGARADALDAFSRGGAAPPHLRTPAEQRKIYEQLYAVMPDNASRGELWNSYRETRGRFDAAQGGFGDFTRMAVGNVLLLGDPPTRIDGGLQVAHPSALGPPPGDYAVESKGGSSFSPEQADRYHKHIVAHGGTLIGKDSKSYAGVVYLFDNIQSANQARSSHDKAGRSGSIYVGYLDSGGNIQWLPRTVAGPGGVKGR